MSLFWIILTIIELGGAVTPRAVPQVCHLYNVYVFLAVAVAVVVAVVHLFSRMLRLAIVWAVAFF